MSTFDPSLFLDQQTTDANSTQVTPLPAGEYLAVVKKFEVRQWQSKKDPTKSGVALDIQWDIQDQAVLQEIDVTSYVVKQGVMLDLNEAGTGLDMGKGKNVGLGRLREALGLNTPGQPFAMSMIGGRMAKVKTIQETAEDDPEKIYCRVSAVAPA